MEFEISCGTVCSSRSLDKVRRERIPLPRCTVRASALAKQLAVASSGQDPELVHTCAKMGNNTRPIMKEDLITKILSLHIHMQICDPFSRNEP